MEKTRYGTILSICTAVFTVVVGILLIVSSMQLVATGEDNPYSRERVGEYLSLIFFPGIITLALVIAGIIYDATSKNAKKCVLKRTNLDILRIYSAKIDESLLPEKLKESVLEERKKRRLAEIVAYALSLLFLLFVAVYVAFIADYTVDSMTADISSALTLVLPVSLAALLLHIPKVYYVENSAKREYKLLSDKSLQVSRKSGKKTVSEHPYEKKITVALRVAVLGVAVVFVAVGAANGGMGDVLAKAVKICTECIGLG